MKRAAKQDAHLMLGLFAILWVKNGEQLQEATITRGCDVAARMQLARAAKARCITMEP